MEAATEELAAPLELFPQVDFCCAYGSSLLPGNNDKSSMVDYIFGVADPVKWHAENLERNRLHYAKWMALLGPKAITCIAERIGVGVHFNPFVQWRQKMIKYGVVGMEDLSRDLMMWDRSYIYDGKNCCARKDRIKECGHQNANLSSVHLLVDNHGIGKVNAVNLKSALTAALLLSPSEFTEEDLYSKICSLSYMGDVRMLFAEDKNKVKKIVQGHFSSFQATYRDFIADYINNGFLKSTSREHQKAFEQDCRLPSTIALVSALPNVIRCRASLEKLDNSMNGDGTSMSAIAYREVAADRTKRILRRLVMTSSVRQAAAGILAAGGVNAARYLGRKMSKAWSSHIL